MDVATAILGLENKEQTKQEEKNLKAICHIQSIPGDTQMRAALDPLDPSPLRAIFPKLFNTLNEAGVINDLCLCESAIDVKVNYLLYEQADKQGKVTRWAWITNIPLNARSVEPVMRAGRARWKIENETFNTLKNQGYNFEHNYGQGKQNLATILALLMFLAFTVDQMDSAMLATVSSGPRRPPNKGQAMGKCMQLVQGSILPHYGRLISSNS